MTIPTQTYSDDSAHIASKPVDDRPQNSENGLSAQQILGRLSVADTDLPKHALSGLAEQLHRMTQGNFQAVESYVDQIESVLNLAKPDQVAQALDALAWLPAEVREEMEVKIRARHRRERQQEVIQAGMQELEEKSEKKQDFVRRVLGYLKSKFEGMMQSSALKAARDAGQALFLSGVVNDPSQVISLSQQQELGPSVTPGMAVGRGKAQTQGAGMRQITKRK